MSRRVPQRRGNPANQTSLGKADSNPAVGPNNDLLPPEILEQIFRFLLATDPVVGSLALVCRSWFTQADRLRPLHTHLHSRSRLKWIIEHLRGTKNFGVKIQSLTLTQGEGLGLRDKDLFGLVKLYKATDLTDLHSLRLNGYHTGDYSTMIAPSLIVNIRKIPIPDSSPYAFPHLRSLDLRNVHPQVAASILSACDPNKLEELTMSSLVAPGPPPRPLPWATQLPSLHSLTSVFAFPSSGDLTTTCLLSSSPNLERFKILIAQKDLAWMVRSLWQVPPNAFRYLSVHVLQGLKRDPIRQTVEELTKLAGMKGWAHEITAHDAWSPRKVQEILLSA